MRWAIPTALLLFEYLFISFLVDLPTSGPAMPFVHAVRLAVPVILGSFAAGWMLRGGASRRVDLVPLPPWKPWPAIALQPLAFAVTAVLAYRILGDGAPPASTSGVALVLASAAATAVLAIWISAPASWFAEVLVRRWGFPLLAVAVGVLAWRAAAGAEELWGVLSGSTLRCAALLLRLVSPHVTVGPEPNVIAFGDFRVRVTQVCSGADGIGLVVLFQAMWIALARERLRPARALLLIPLGVVLAFAANVARIAALLWVGGSGEVTLAVGGLHSKLGWILFIAIALGTITIAERIPWFRRGNGEGWTDAEALPAAAAAYLAPLIAALVAALVTSIWSTAGLERWYVVRILAASGMLLVLRHDLPRPSFSPSWLPLFAAAIICAAWVGLVRADGPAAARLYAAVQALAPVERWSWILVRILGSCLVIPVVEELAFRGFLLRWLISPDFERVPPRAWTWPALLLSSLAFGALHRHWIVGAFAGLAFAAVLLRRGRLSEAILAHGLTNAGIAVAVLAFGRWDLWV